MLNEFDILKDVSNKLEKLKLPFMLTGSLAMSHYTEPRMTRDLDIVIQIHEHAIKNFCDEFAKDYYLAKEAITDAVKTLFIFNIIHLQSNVKVDFIVRKNSEFRLTEFERRKKISFGDFETWVASKEDLIISKIELINISDSDLQKRDVNNLLKSGYDIDYLLYWLKKLNLLEIYEKLI